MRLLTGRTLREYHQRPGRSDAEPGIAAWIEEAERAEWRTFADVKSSYGTASAVGDDRVVFNIGGNKHRLIVGIDYRAGIVYVKFIGTHAEYDRIDARTVDDY